MNYFAQFLRTDPPGSLKPSRDIVAEFHHAWNVIHYTLCYPDERQLARGIQATNVPACLKTITDHLVTEATRTEEGTTGACLEYLLKNDILGELVRLSQNDRPFGIQAQVLRSIANMVCMLDEHFLVHTAVHRPVLKLLKNCVGDELEECLDGRSRVMGAASTSQQSKPSRYEEDLVDLLCTLCSRIRTYRDLLMIFFYDRRWFRAPSPPLDFGFDDENDEERIPDTPTSNEIEFGKMHTDLTLHQDSESSKPEYEFIIFNYLLRFVHREGRIGDFARAGMLFLIDVAMDRPDTSEEVERSVEAVARDAGPASEVTNALADYILEGDFAEVLSAGLAAVYSLLPSKLKLIPCRNATPSGLSLFSGDEYMVNRSDEVTQGIPLGLSCSPDLCSKIDHFLTILEFIQDVLKRDRKCCPIESQPTLGDTILVAVRKVFLDNILYPSILESSEFDGSSVAVMSYLEASFRTLAPGPLVNSLLEYLSSEGGGNGDTDSLFDHLTPSQSRAEKATKVQRRKSSAMILLEMEVPVSKGGNDYARMLGRFTLKDLVKTNLNSGIHQAATAALLLLQTLIYVHCEISTGVIIDIETFETKGIPLWSHTLRDISDSLPGTAFVPINAYAVQEKNIQMYRTLTRVEEPLDIAFSTAYLHYLEDSIRELMEQRCFRDQHGIHIHPHNLRKGDSVLATVISSFCHFFTHGPQQNIALTGLLVKLALCPHRSLEGWLTIPVDRQTRPLVHKSDGAGLEEALEKIGSSQATPIVFRIMRDLFAGINMQRMVIDNFDRLLIERRQVLLFSENLQDAIRRPFDLDSKKLARDAVEISESYNTPTKKSRTSLLSFLTPTIRASGKAKREEVNVGARSSGGHTIPGMTPSASNPFKEHYEETRAIQIEPPMVELPKEGPWLGNWADVEEDVFGTSGVWEDVHGPARNRGVRMADRKGDSTSLLSELLDNIVILEECAKELAAVIEARGCLGIDPMNSQQVGVYV